MAWEAQTSIPARGALGRDSVAEGRRAFMARVYRWMFFGLALTGGVSVYTVSNEAVLRFVMGAYLPLIIGELVLVMALSFMMDRLSGTVAAAMFAGYAALNGLTLSAIFLVYQLGSIGQAFFLTAGVFGAMSLYATFTKSDLSAWRTFLFMGLIGVVVAGVVNIFMRSDALGFITACACVLVFAGLTAYDTQKLRQMYADARAAPGGTLAIRGALSLYLDFINLFLAVLRLFGRRR
ncbi:MAG TPA: Bax inhibitor-1/YccA family protein [Myxococcaceae bacterium]|nr:Bax inhibitor-1/YccA family protein [Myxococcaceae bacterium]